MGNYILKLQQWTVILILNPWNKHIYQPDRAWRQPYDVNLIKNHGKFFSYFRWINGIKIYGVENGC